jgi:hypothetical protein
MAALTGMPCFSASSLRSWRSLSNRARGEFKISRVFTDDKAANKARYRYYRTENGVIMYARRDRAGNALFAVVDK